VLAVFLAKPAVEVAGLALFGADAVQQSAASSGFLRRKTTRLPDDARPLVQQADQIEDMVADQALALFPWRGDELGLSFRWKTNDLNSSCVHRVHGRADPSHVRRAQDRPVPARLGIKGDPE